VSSSSTSDKELRNFGIVMAIAFGVVAIFTRPEIFGSISVTFLLLGLLATRVLAPVHRVWMKFADVLGWINTRILLVLVYYLVVTPTGLVMRLFGRKPISAGYWEKATKHSYGDKHFEKQF
jgi:hypothetical protein